MKRGVMGLAVCMTAAVLILDRTAENGFAQGAAIAKSKGWQVEGSLNPATLKAAGNKPIMLVFR
jgi:hypothetical protein